MSRSLCLVPDAGPTVRPGRILDLRDQRCELTGREGVAAACEDVLSLLRPDQRGDETQELVTHMRAIEAPRRIAGDMRDDPLMRYRAGENAHPRLPRAR